MNISCMAAHHVDLGTPLATNADTLNGGSFLPLGAAAVPRFVPLILMGIGLADPEKLATVGRERGHQVLIKRNDSEYGLYTVSQVRQERPDKTKLATKSTAGCRPCPIRQNDPRNPAGQKKRRLTQDRPTREPRLWHGKSCRAGIVLRRKLLLQRKKRQ
jgi:hypothetical protein